MNHHSLIIAKNLFSIFKKEIIFSMLITISSYLLFKIKIASASILWISMLISLGYSLYVAYIARYFIPSSGNIKGFNFKYFFSLPIKSEHLILGLFLCTAIQFAPLFFFIAVFNSILAKMFLLKISPIFYLTFFSVCMFLVFTLINILWLRTEILKPRIGLQKIDSWSQNLEILMGLFLILLAIRISNMFPAYFSEDYFFEHIMMTGKILPLLIFLNILTTYSTLRLMRKEKACYRAPLLQSTFKKIMFFIISLGLTLSFIYA